MRSKRISAVEYAQALIERTVSAAALNGYISHDPGLLLAQARAADELLARDPQSCGALHAVPLALKDNINTVDLPTTGGTPALRGHRPPQDAPIWQTLRAAGAVLAGKANMHEMAFGGTNDNASYGRASNPFDRARVPGGSSGGSAVIVAARLVPACIGSDTAGSVRVPAALCGQVGFRPTHGRYPGAGIIPLSHSRDTAGPMARSVEDVALLDAVITRSASQMTSIEPQRLRLGVDRARFFDKVNAEVVGVVDAALAKLAQAGVTLVDVKADPLRPAPSNSGNIILDRELIEDVRAYLAAYAPHLTMEQLHRQAGSAALRELWTKKFAAYPSLDRVAYDNALTTELPALRAAHHQLFSEYRLDALIAPTTPEAALPFAGDDSVVLNGNTVSSWLYFTNTSFAPARGSPSVSLPCGTVSGGLPVGVLLDGNVGKDRELLAVAACVESILRVTLRPPMN